MKAPLINKASMKDTIAAHRLITVKKQHDKALKKTMVAMERAISHMASYNTPKRCSLWLKSPAEE